MCKEELNKLVVCIIDSNRPYAPTARQIYEEARRTNKPIMYHEDVLVFKRFVQFLNKEATVLPVRMPGRANFYKIDVE